MFKQIVTLLLSFCLIFSAEAKHIKGGWIEYKYNGVGATTNTSSYTFTTYLLVTCDASVQYPASSLQNVYLGLFDASTNALVTTLTIPNSGEVTLSKNSYNPCLSNPPTVCFKVFSYTATVDVANNANGYVLALQDAQRSLGIINASSNQTGITITNGIPGTIGSVDYHINSSPAFIFKDTTILCHNSSFQYQFSATDADGDSLSYAFGDGLNVNNASGFTFNPPSNPPYSPMTYYTGYSGTQPLGSGVTIDAATGLISGVAPATTGEYILAVYVTEWRNGIKINVVKKELQIFINNCSLSAASLDPVVLNCSNYSQSFQNQSTASNITSYHWDFGVTTTTSDTSTSPVANFIYPDSGTYIVKLLVANTGGCRDSATSSVKIYPGLKADFTAQGSCYQSPFIFTDASTIGKSGSISLWHWDFGVSNLTTDTSNVKNPQYTYPVAGTYSAILKVTTNKGCTYDTTKTVTVNDKPYINLPFRDTLICSIDSLPLIAQSTTGAVFSWSPNYNIINPNTANPTVYPHDSTIYKVTVTDKGCVDTATVKVNVLQYISVSISPTANLCLTDSVTLTPISYALSYLWSPATALSSTTVKYPKASPNSKITYYVQANLGKCVARDSITIYTAPYPEVNAGKDTAICYGKIATLQGKIKSSLFYWTADSTLNHTYILNPIATPKNTTAYILNVQDTSYCKKIVSDTVIVTVVPQVMVNAGRDTAVVIDQSFQLTATGIDTAVGVFQWTPSIYLNNSNVYNPIATITSVHIDAVHFIVKATVPPGCSNTDTVVVKVFKTPPDIFIPTGFTPNGDGRNDVLKPILVGIKQFKYFSVYNRWGQIVFTTTNPYNGWDGTVNGNKQDAATYVFVAEGIDYLGTPILKKGTVVLIR